MKPKVVKKIWWVFVIATCTVLLWPQSSQWKHQWDSLAWLLCCGVNLFGGWMWGYGNAARDVRKALFNDFIAIRSQNNRARREAQMINEHDLRN